MSIERANQRKMFKESYNRLIRHSFALADRWRLLKKGRADSMPAPYTSFGPE